MGPETPDGFLALVTSVSYKGEGTKLTTKPTTLRTAVPSGSIDIKSGGFGALSSSDRARPLNRLIKCGAGGVVEVSGAVSLSPTFSLQASWSLFGGVSSRFEAGLRMNADLTASARAAASCKAGPVTLARWFLPPIDIQVGPIPVVFVPEVKIVLSGDGSVSAQLATGLHGTVTASGGLAYDHGKAHRIGGVTHSFRFDPPSPTGQAHIGGSVGPTLALLLYGVAGPEVDLRAGVSLDADTSANPWWRLTAPVSLGAKLAIPGLGINTGELSIYRKSIPLADAGAGFGPPPPVAGIAFDGSPATNAPPPTLGPYRMTPFAADPQETGEVFGVDGPTGRLTFDAGLDHEYANTFPVWKTWSNGYEGDVYATQFGATSATVRMPSGTKAFYLYAEPEEFATFDFTVSTQDGTTSGAVPVDGEGGAKYFGFYATGSATIQSVTVSCPEDQFAVGEFGISAG